MRGGTPFGPCAIAGPGDGCNDDIKISLCRWTIPAISPEPWQGARWPSKWPISWFRVARLHLADGTAAFVTIHPSFLLRIKDEADKAREYRHFVADLRQAAKVLTDQAA